MSKFSGNNKKPMRQSKPPQQPASNVRIDDSQVIKISSIAGNNIDATMQMVTATPEVAVNTAVINNHGNRAKRSGEGEINALLDGKSKQDLVNQICNLQQTIDLLKEKVDRENWTEGELGIYNKVMLKNFDPDNNDYNKYYNNNIQPIKRSIVQIEAIIKEIPPALSYYTVSGVFSSGQKWAVLNHSAGTINILNEFYPYHDFSIVKILQNNSGTLRGLQLCMQSKLFPKKITYYYGVPGKVEAPSGAFKQSEDKIIQTYAEKFANCFNFLKTIKIDPNVAADAKNFLGTINYYKNQFLIVHEDYKFVFDLIIDQIAHFYLDNGQIPSSKDFNSDVLLKCFPIDDMYKSDLFYSDEEAERYLGIPSIITKSCKFPRDYYTAKTIMRGMVRRAIYYKKLPFGKRAKLYPAVIKEDYSKQITFPDSVSDRMISYNIGTERKRMIQDTISKRMEIEGAHPVDEMIDAQVMSLANSGIDPLESMRGDELNKILESMQDLQKQDGNTGVDVNANNGSKQIEKDNQVKDNNEDQILSDNELDDLF